MRTWAGSLASISLSKTEMKLKTQMKNPKLKIS